MESSRIQLNALIAAAALFTAACSPQEMAPQAASYVLAISWQPAFCETAPRKPECRSQTANRYDASNFALHGLWPQPRSQAYCGVDGATEENDRQGRWHDLPWNHLDENLWQRLRRMMPGTKSGLHKHEWIKHGTCMKGTDATHYFAVSLDLLEQVNTSAMRELFASSIGRKLDGDDIRAAFEADFGKGSGSRLRIACERDGSRQIIREVTIGLRGAPRPGLSRQDMQEMIAASEPTDPGCPRGIVDPVGLQ